MSDPASFVVDGPAVLPLRWGADTASFTLLHFAFGADRWVAAYTGDLYDGAPVPLRIESACLFGHVLRSAQCDCGYQLDATMHEFCRSGRGLLVYGVDQDARGLGLAAHFAIYQMRQQENLDTDEVYRRLDAPMDARSYEPVAAILAHLGVDSVRLLSNNPKREAFLRSHEIAVTTQALEAPLDTHNMSTLMLEKEDLGYRWSFATHADWLAPLQARVENRPDHSRAQLVRPGAHPPEGLIAEAEDDGDWTLAARLASVAPATLATEPLVVYLTDLPRVDELARYAQLGTEMLVVPFADVPSELRAAAGPSLRIVDWARRNAYRRERPQWIPVEIRANRHVYRRGDRVRVVTTGGRWTEHAATDKTVGPS